MKFQIACLRENGHGLYRVVTEVHESRKNFANSGFVTKVQAIIGETSAPKMWRDGIEKIDISKHSKEIPTKLFLIFERS